MTNPSRNLACSWITTHYLLVSRAALPITCLFRLYLPVVPLTQESQLSSNSVTVWCAIAMLLAIISPATDLWPAVQRCWKTRDTPVLFSTAFWVLALLPSTRRVANPVTHAVSFAPGTPALLAALLSRGSTCTESTT